MARSYECAECGAPIMLGDEYWMSPVSDERMFCSEECMRKWIIDSGDALDSVVEDWIEVNAECYDMEPDDPYDRYGVNESDFH